MNITDVRDILPYHKTKRWKQRNLTDIKGVVFHQTLGDQTFQQINKYHISDNNHLSATGCPHICYAVYVDKNGEIFLCNNFEDITWSQGGIVRPFQEWKANKNYLGICFQGDFSGGNHIGSQEPTLAQLNSAIKIWDWLSELLHLSQMDLFGHYHFGKPACPGDVLMKLIENIREKDLTNLLPKTNAAWQLCFKSLGYNLGNSGMNKDGVDGVWGLLSQQALISFQKNIGLTNSCIKDTLTQQFLAWECLALSSELRTYRK